MEITVQELGKSYGALDLFQDFSMRIQSGMRLAVAGHNGAGKSTFLKMLAGVTEPDRGRIIYPKGARIGYSTQDLTEEDLDTPLLPWIMRVLPSWDEFWREWEKVQASGDEARMKEMSLRQAELEQSFGYNPEHRARTVLTGLGFSDEKAEAPLVELSGGWRERAKLARVLTAGADVLLLDEPTNHLDLEAVEWLESFLKEFAGAMVFVAHDRIFMDRVGTHMLFLGGSKPVFSKGSYSDFLVRKEELDEQQRRESERLSDELERKMDFVRRFKAKATKARQAASKKKQAVRIEKQLSELTPEPRRKTLSFTWPEPKPGDKVPIRVDELIFSFDDQDSLWSPLSFTLYYGKKVAVVGPNGCGKSTLLKLIMGKLSPDSGSVYIGPKTEIAYFSQHQTEMLYPNKTVLSEIRRFSAPDASDEEVMSVLGLFMLGQEWFERTVSELSGGEKSRLILASLFTSGGNCLVLDEPTNHLDLESREALINALSIFPGTVLMVAHDRYFMQSVADEVWGLSSEGLALYEHGYAEYESNIQESDGPEPEESRAKEASKQDAKQLRREKAERRNALYKKLKPMQDEYTALEKRLEEAACGREDAEKALSDPELYEDADQAAKYSKEYAANQKLCDELMERMSELEGGIRDLEEQRTALNE